MAPLAPSSEAEQHDDSTGSPSIPVEIRPWESRAAVDHQVLFGVDRIIRQLDQALRSPTSGWIVGLRGEGGVGKTAIAYEVARRCEFSGAFQHVLWTTMKGDRGLGVDDYDSDERAAWSDVVRDLGDQIGLPMNPSRSLWEHELRQAISEAAVESRLLVVVDNLEYAAEATLTIGRLQDLGVTKPHKLLATTRWAIPSDSGSLREYSIHGLNEKDALALIRQTGEGDESLESAPDEAFKPVVRITDGNPYLIKLVVRYYLSTGRSLERIIRELINERNRVDKAEGALGSSVRDYLFTRSLAELDRLVGPEQAHKLMAAFCAKRRGEEIQYDALQRLVDLPPEVFRSALECAFRLGLVRSSDRNRRYSIHSLLYEFTVSSL